MTWGWFCILAMVQRPAACNHGGTGSVSSPPSRLGMLSQGAGSWEPGTARAGCFWGHPCSVRVSWWPRGKGSRKHLGRRAVDGGEQWGAAFGGKFRKLRSWMFCRVEGNRPLLGLLTAAAWHGVCGAGVGEEARGACPWHFQALCVFKQEPENI